MPLFSFNPVSFLKKTRKFRLISISPILLFLNSFFELLALILLFSNDCVPLNDFIIYMIFASIIFLATLIFLVYFQKKMDNLYPFHNVFLSFLLVFLFSDNENVSAHLDLSQFTYFLGFLSATMQIVTMQKGSILIGIGSIILTILLYFFYFIKNCQSILVFVYYFLLVVYIILLRLDSDLNESKEEAEMSECEASEEVREEVLEKVMKTLIPGNFFVLGYEITKLKENSKVSLKDTGVDTFHNNFFDSPLKSLENVSNLLYRNQGCLDYGLESKRDLLVFLENVEISNVNRIDNIKNQEKLTRIDIASKASTQRPFIDNHLINTNPHRDIFNEIEEKESEFIQQENQKRNLLVLLKNRLESQLEIEENMTITGHINTIKGKRSIKLIFSQFVVKSNGFLFFHFIEMNPDEDVKNMKEFSHLKDQMLANVAHDLRSPLSGIIAFIDQSLDPTLSKPERDKLLEFAKINANLLLHLIGDILDFSQLKKGCLNLVIKSFSLKDIVDQIFRLMKYQAELKNIRLLLDFQPALDLKLESDDRRLCQLLINLLTNSIKFTMKGFVCLRISQTRYQNLLKFEVIDTGIGIKPEIKPLLFKPFSTFSDQSLHNKYGIGLGLSICKTIVSLLGPCDELFVSSEYEKGSKFGFLLFTKVLKVENSSLKLNKTKLIWDKSDFRIRKKPLMEFLNQNPKIEDTDEDAKIDCERDLRLNLDLNERVDVAGFFNESLNVQFPDEEEKLEINKEMVDNGKIEGDMQSFETKKGNMKKVFSLNNLTESKIKLTENSVNVLIVDDNPFNIFIFKNYLKKYNSNNLVFNVLSAANGSQACELFEEYNNPNNKEKNRQIHVIFMDCQMPIMSGYQATMNIKEKINKEGYMKALIVAVTAYCNEDVCMECGMDAYLLKPVSEKDFLEILEIFFC